MDPSLAEWLHLALRWLHVIAGIMWIGSSIFFNWLDRHLVVPEGAAAGVEGELWMVHSGGFYRVEKKLVAPEALPKTLHWFKWEAAFTWLSGFFLLLVVYYMGGGVYLVDTEKTGVGFLSAAAVGLGLIALSWPAYDGLFRSPLGRSRAAGVVAFGLVVAIAYGLTRALSGRAAYLHVGAMLGTVMVANVWMRIIPAQRALVAAVREGRKPDAELARRAKERSKHNNIMTYPVLFVMISNHFPMTYGSAASWAILGCAFVVGASIRHYQNVRDPSPSTLLGALGFAALLAVAMALPRQGEDADETRARAERRPAPASDPAPATSGPSPRLPPAPTAETTAPDGEAALAGTIRGVVRLTGTPPRPRPLAIPAECGHAGAQVSEEVVSKDGKLANVFVSIRSGLRGWKGAPRKDEVVIDQRGCVYSPRVVGVEVGQPVSFVNGDAIMHNVHVVSQENESFNLGVPGRGTRVTKHFLEPEQMITVKCDVHPWMRSYIGVSPHPFFAVTDNQGRFTIPGVPPGEYEVFAWHEVLGTQGRHVSVAAGAEPVAEFSFAAP